MNVDILKMISASRVLIATLLACLLFRQNVAFAPARIGYPLHSSSSEASLFKSRTLNAHRDGMPETGVAKIFATSGLLVASLILATAPAWADEIGKETEAPTLFTGETVLVRERTWTASRDL